VGEVSASVAGMEKLVCAYISAGHLYLVDDQGEAHEVKSEFAANLEEKAEKIRTKEMWKSGGDSGAMGMSPWGPGAGWSDDFSVAFTSVSKGKEEGSIYYFLRTPSVGGLFRYEVEEKEERRIFHKEAAYVSDIEHHPKSKFLTGSLSSEEGSNIVMFENSSFGFRPLTEGDSVDALPSWNMEDQVSVVYQSAGLGRDSEGHVVGLAPCSIEQVNVKTGDHQVLLEREEKDLLSPKKTKDGVLYYIERPYEHGATTMSMGKSAKELAMLPFRVAKTGYLIVDSLSKLFRKKPLIESGRKYEHSGKNEKVYLKGAVIDLSKSAKTSGKDDASSVVPSTWVLRTLQADGEGEELANCVLDYDLNDDGEVLYTNGKSIFKGVGSKRKKLFTAKGVIEEVCWL